jgi:uncharacterized oxidoreductase
MRIQGSTILVTGGGQGIGRAVAEAFHARGARVIVTGRNTATLSAVVAANPGMAWYALDMQDARAIKAFAAKIAAERPELSVLVNNAGIMVAEDLTADPVDLAVPEAIVATNLLGPIRLTAALLPHLKAQPRATVMNVTSGLAFVPLVATPTYNATKAAMHSYSQSLRTQLRDTSVEVVEWAPPAVATDLMPGHAENPHAMPLADFIAESVALMEKDDGAEEILVERVRFLRDAEREGRYAQTYATVNRLA